MWVFLNNAFLSIVEYRDDPTQLLVRGRFDGDIEAVFPEAITFTKKASDYKHRAIVSRERVAEVIAESVKGIDYTNFKNSVAEKDRKDVYEDVWFEMYKEQCRRDKSLDYSATTAESSQKDQVGYYNHQGNWIPKLKWPWLNNTNK